MATKAKVGKGTTLKRDSTGGGVFVTIGEVVSVDGLDRSNESADATSCDSTAVERIPTIVDNGKLSFSCLHVGTDSPQQGLENDMEAGTLRAFEYILNDQPSGGSNPSKWAFSALVTNVKGAGFGSVKDSYKIDFTLEVSGAVTYTPAA